jgi:cytochrome P450
MLTGIDRQSGEKLDDTNIIAQCNTFLVAGHETTSGLLSFALYALIKHPEVLARAYDEVDRVLGADLSVVPTYAQIHQVPFVAQILDETLRLWPAAPVFTRHPYEDTVIGGKYRLEKDTRVTVLIGICTATRKCGVRTPRGSTRTVSASRTGPRSRQMATSLSEMGSALASADSSRCKKPPSCWL